MATLSTDKARPFQLGDHEEYPVIAADTIFEGAAVGEDDAGYARPLQAGDRFLGFALETADNEAGSAGDVRVRVLSRGRVEVTVAAIGITANDRAPVYASDDDTFTLTRGANSCIGAVSRWVSTGIAVVEFDAFAATLHESAVALGTA